MSTTEEAREILFPDLEGICTDGDGTLYDTEELLFRAHREILEERGHAFDAEQYRKLVGQDVQTVCRLLVETFGLSETPDELHDLRRERLRRLMPQLRLMPGVPEALDRWRRTGAPLALVTSATDAHAVTALDRFGIRGRFRARIAADTPGLAALKPDPAPYLLAAHALRAKPGRCVAFEDTAHGACAARFAGMIVVGIPHRFSPREAFDGIAHHVVPDGKTIGDFDFREIAHLLPQRRR